MTLADLCNFFGSLLASPGMGYIISSLVVVGMLVGAIVKHAGWGVKDVWLWLVVLVVYMAGVLTIVVRTGQMNLGSAIISVAIMAFVLFFYQTGVFVGIWIVKRERRKSRAELENWEKFYRVVKGVDKGTQRSN